MLCAARSTVSSQWSSNSASESRCVVEPLEGRALLSAGDVDTTFGAGGMVVTDLVNHANTRPVAVQADGKILVATTEFVSEERLQVVLLRYRTDGSLDPTFGSGGKVVTAFTEANHATDIDLTPGGKIVLTLDARTYVRNEEGRPVISRSSLGLARFNSDGTPDLKFSGD